MSGRIIALGFAALVGAASAQAASSGPRPGEWTHEGREYGEKVSIEVFTRQPYALTGSSGTPTHRPSPGEWTREARQVGKDRTVDLYSR